MQIVIAGKEPSHVEEYLVKSGHKVKSFYVNDISLDIARAFNPEVFIYMDDVVDKIPHEQALKQLQNYRVLIIAEKDNPVIPFAAALGIKDFVFHPCELEAVLHRVENPATAMEAAELVRYSPKTEMPEAIKKPTKGKNIEKAPSLKEPKSRSFFNLAFLNTRIKQETQNEDIVPLKSVKQPRANTVPNELELTTPDTKPKLVEKTSTKRWQDIFIAPKSGVILKSEFYGKASCKSPLEMLDEEVDAIVIPADWGIKAIKDFRRDPRSKTIPLIVLRGNNESFAAGADICVKKLNQQVINDATALSSRLRSMWASVETDALTGVYSRRFLNNWLQERIRQKVPFSAVMLDLDHFKNVNDTYGHKAGDAVLSCFGQFIKQQIRSTDIAGRYGGEEFLIFLPNTNKDEGYVLIERLREKWIEHKTLTDDGQSIQCTFSAGIAQWSENVDVVAMADKQVYLAKEKGRNQVQKADAVFKVLLLGEELSRQTANFKARGLNTTIDPNEATVVVCDIQSIQYAPKNIDLYVLGTGSVVDWAASRIRTDACILRSVDDICDRILGINDPSLINKDSSTASKVPNLSVLPGVRSTAKTQSIPLHGALYVVCPSKPGEASEMAVKLCQTIDGSALICAAPESTAGVILKIPQEKLIVSDWRFIGAEAPVMWTDIAVWPIDPFKHSNIAKLDEIQSLIDQIKSRFEITIIDCGARLDMCSRVAGNEGVIIIYTDGDSTDVVAQQWLKNCTTGKVISMSPAEIPNAVIGENGFVISAGQIDATAKKTSLTTS